MPSFPKPTFDFTYDLGAEIRALLDYRNTKPGRSIPNKHADRLLIATWNIANLGRHKRRDQDYRILAEIVSWFDIIAPQEVNDNLEGLRAIQSLLPGDYRTIFSDRSGNDERMAFLYDADKIEPMEKFGEIAIPVAKHMVVPGDPIYEALRRRGLRRPEHSTRIHSNIANDKDYDQILFFPGPVKQALIGNNGIFDFDSAVFRALFESRTRGMFKAYLRYYLSDRRPIWAEFDIA